MRESGGKSRSVDSEYTEEQLAQMLGYSSVKAMKLALISHKDYVSFMNKGNLADRDNVQEYRASKYQGIYEKAVDLTGFIASFCLYTET